MSFPNPSTAMAHVIVDELIRNGAVFAVASPGSRSTAVLLALDERPEIQLVMHIDERSAGFRALGNAVAGGGLSLVVTTSGSAVANLAPAVVEAERAGVPLVVLTADRPADLVSRRANQTMDHFGVFDGFVRSRSHLGPPSAEVDGNLEWRDVVSRLALAAKGGERPPGPVHLNVAFAEPTVPVSDDGRTSASEYSFGVSPPPDGLDEIPDSELRMDVPEMDIDSGERVLAIAGTGDYDGRAFAGAARSSGVPVMATATSGARGEAGTLNAFNHWLIDGFPTGMAPSMAIVAGQVNPADRLIRALTHIETVVHVDRFGVFSDPEGSMTSGLKADPTELVKRLPRQDPDWSESLTTIDTEMRMSLSELLEHADNLTGPGVANTIDGSEWEALVVGSSLAIRDVESHVMRGGWVHSNRGVSGIDGFSSTVLGVAGQKRRTVGLVGDLSFLHDSNAFLTDQLPPAVFVVVDNGGGGLFDLLPQAQHAPHFERLFVTPHHRDLRHLAEFHDIKYADIDDRSSLQGELSDAITSEFISVIRVGVERKTDLAMRSALDESAREVLFEFKR